MIQAYFTVESNIRLAKDTYEIVLLGDTSSITNSGQFVNIKIDGLYLRRPISVCDYTEGKLTLIYKVVGEGTKVLSTLNKGARLDLLVGLGNGYDTSLSGETPLLIGGGVGIPPMYNLCKKLIAENKKPSVILGFNSSEEVFYKEQFEKLGVKVYICTVDGSVGTKGFVTDVMKDLDYSYFFTCGPMPMFRAIEKIAVTSGQFSFEERMGCGFGGCVGCTCKTKYKNKRICIDGPVLVREEIIW